jgi:hypothetical protein
LGEVTRDRDASGRPENARPRDATGKPLPRGSGPSWRERLRALDEVRALPPAEALAEAERLVLDGNPFYAHEVLEGPWHLAPPEERAFWQGLAKVAVGLTHIQRGNAIGARSVLNAGADLLATYEDGHAGVAVSRIVAQARALAERDVTTVTPEELRVPFR